MVEVALQAVGRRSFDLRRVGSLVLMAASGFAGLGYQIVWTQQGASWLGHESAAVFAVVAAFFAGLAVGALVFGRRIERSARPVRWYVACEAVIGAWSLVLLVAMAPFGEWLLRAHGRRSRPRSGNGRSRSSGRSSCCCRRRPRWGRRFRRSSASCRSRRARAVRSTALYAANTFGATAGVLAAAFWLVPSIGLTAHGRRLHRAQRALRRRRIGPRRARRSVIGRFVPGRPGPRSARRRAAPVDAAGRDGPARYRLRGPRDPRSEPGLRGHRVHVRDAARRLPARDRRRRGRPSPPRCATTGWPRRFRDHRSAHRDAGDRLPVRRRRACGSRKRRETSSSRSSGRAWSARWRRKPRWL